MSIVCGTDFSEASLRAARAAAMLAARAHVALHLVHVVELAPERVFSEPRTNLIDWSERELRATAAELRGLGADVEVHLEIGAPDERMEEVAARVGAKLVIVAPLGKRRSDKWKLGSNAYRLSHNEHVPVLLVHDLQPFEAWIQQKRPLRILLGADLSLSTEAAARWIQNLQAFGACDVVAVYLYWPPEQFQRLGLSGIRSYVDPAPEVQKALLRALSTRLSTALGSPPIKIRTEPHLGRIGERLAALAVDEHADLVVVGSHGRSTSGRLLHGSVSHDVIHSADISVACVPAPVFSDAASTPRIASVLVATDFSATANTAVPLAYSVVADGATVHLVHVMKERGQHAVEPHDIFAGAATDADAQAIARDRLLELIPGDASSHRTATQLHVLVSNDVPLAICQAAERLDAGMLCIGTHGRTGLSKVVLGSVAQAVLSGTRRPVLVARKPVE